MVVLYKKVNSPLQICFHKAKKANGQPMQKTEQFYLLTTHKKLAHFKKQGYAIK